MSSIHNPILEKLFLPAQECKMSTLLAPTTVGFLALMSCMAHAENLLFSDPNAIEDWWYTDQSSDGSLMLTTKSNSPGEVPLYLICKDHAYSLLFQPPVQPIKDPSGQQVWRYTIGVDNYPDSSNRFPKITASVRDDGHAERVTVTGDGMAWLLKGRSSITIVYASADGKSDVSFYTVPPVSASRLFLNRCSNQGYSHEPPPLPQ